MAENTRTHIERFPRIPEHSWPPACQGRKVPERAVPDEFEWIALIAQGNEAAFQTLYEAYYARLWRYVWYQLGPDAASVEDVLQNIFLAIWRSAGRFRGEAKVSTWIFQIAHNLVSTARRAQHTLAEGSALLADHSDDEMEHPEMREGSFEDAAVSRITLIDAIDHLSAKHQAVIFLVFVQGFTVEEVAHILRIPSNTVKSRVLGARRALLKRLHTPGIADGGAL